MATPLTQYNTSTILVYATKFPLIILRRTQFYCLHDWLFSYQDSFVSFFFQLFINLLHLFPPAFIEWSPS